MVSFKSVTLMHHLTIMGSFTEGLGGPSVYSGGKKS
jgi:hypothetical protein